MNRFHFVFVLTLCSSTDLLCSAEGRRLGGRRELQARKKTMMKGMSGGKGKVKPTPGPTPAPTPASTPASTTASTTAPTTPSVPDVLFDTPIVYGSSVYCTTLEDGKKADTEFEGTVYRFLGKDDNNEKYILRPYLNDAVRQSIDSSTSQPILPFSFCGDSNLVTIVKEPYTLINTVDRTHILDLHNKERQQWAADYKGVKLQDLIYSVKLEDYAYQSLERLDATSARCPNLSHDTKYGENLAAGTSLTPERAFQMWVDEERIEPDTAWDFENGHFTQVMWGGTKYVGCAVAQFPGCSMIYLSCQFNRPGNCNIAFDQANWFDLVTAPESFCGEESCPTGDPVCTFNNKDEGSSCPYQLVWYSNNDSPWSLEDCDTVKAAGLCGDSTINSKCTCQCAL